MEEGQATATQEAVTIDSTDSAATETSAFAALFAEASTYIEALRDLFTDHGAAEPEGRVLFDTVQLLAVGNISYIQEALKSIAALDASSLTKGQVLELYTNQQSEYATVAHNLMVRLVKGSEVNSSFITKSPHAKHRQLVRIDGDLEVINGRECYRVSVGTLDPMNPMGQPVWRSYDMVGGQPGAIYIYPVVINGVTAFKRWAGHNKETVKLGDSQVITDSILSTLNSELFMMFQQIASTAPELRTDAIRRSNGSQLVFWKAMELTLAKYRAQQSELTN